MSCIKDFEVLIITSMLMISYYVGSAPLADLLGDLHLQVGSDGHDKQDKEQSSFVLSEHTHIM